MKQIVLILCHKNSQQLNLLLNQLEHENIIILIHLDKKTPKREFIEVVKQFKNVEFIEKRINIGWGSFSQIQAIIELIDEVSKRNIDYSHCHLISGEDALIQSPKKLIDFFSSHPDQSYINHYILPDSRLAKGGLFRVLDYHFGKSKKNHQLISRIWTKSLELLMNKIVIKILPFLRKKLNHPLYAGSAWWSLSKEHLCFVLKYINDNPNFVKMFKTSRCGDELFFQSILLNSNQKDKMINNNYRFIRWGEHHKGSPDYLINDDIDEVKKKDVFFARKIDFYKGSKFYG